MSVDIRELLDEAAGDHAGRPDYDTLWTTGRRRRHLAAGGRLAGVLTVLAVATTGVMTLAGDPTPDIAEQPVPVRPAPADADLPTVEHAVDAAQLTSTATAAGTVITSFPPGAAAGEVGRDEKGAGPSALSAFLPCASGGWCADDAFTGFAFLDGANDRVLVQLPEDGDPVRGLPLHVHGYRSGGALLLQRVAGFDLAFVTVSRTVDAAGVGRVLAIEVASGELVADVPMPGTAANPRLVFGRTEVGEEPRRLWVEHGGGWTAVLEEGREEGTNRVTMLAVGGDVRSEERPLDARTGAAVDLGGAVVEVRWDRVDQRWTFPADVTVKAAHAAHDGLLAVVTGPDGQDLLVRLRGAEVVSSESIGPADHVGPDAPTYAFQPDGTLLALRRSRDGGVEVAAHRPATYARTSPFVGSVPGTLVDLGGTRWVVDECYVAPASIPPVGVCAAQRSVQDGSGTALVEAHIGIDGRPEVEGLRLLTELPGTSRPDLIGVRWARVGGELVHLGVAVGPQLLVYELDTGDLRPAVAGEFDQHR